MESPHHNVPVTGWPLDMKSVEAALPQSDASPTYQHPRHSIDGGSINAWTFYSMYGHPQHDGGGNFRQDVNNARWDGPPPGYNSGPGVYGPAWNTFRPQDSMAMSQATFASGGPMSLGAAPPRSQYVQRTPVPTSPRGPPRKPKRSGHALWVGNLPPFARIEELKDHFSTGATQDIESVFLISKSNCAFVNYRTEGASIAAMNRFHNSRFRGRSLVCRLRRTTSSSSTPSMPSSAELPSSTGEIPKSAETAVVEENPSPLIVGGPDQEQNETPVSDGLENSISKSNIPAKFFILKSLTLEDLEASVSTGSWATQPHNESILDKAYGDAEDVYLVFSANKSGEYFGYARMSSGVSRTLPTRDKSSSTTSTGSSASDAPQTIPTFATATAPPGRIIDDSARGSIFWEADHSDSPKKVQVNGQDDEKKGDGQFAIEWLSTTKIPFYQTRGMRNPWNGNREIKIARDGQELDPRVGRRLLQLFQAGSQPGLVDGVHPRP